MQGRNDTVKNIYFIIEYICNEIWSLHLPVTFGGFIEFLQIEFDEFY